MGVVRIFGFAILAIFEIVWNFELKHFGFLDFLFITVCGVPIFSAGLVMGFHHFYRDLVFDVCLGLSYLGPVSL